ncbi:hypothetical protein STEG23_010930 [Scotinomys teguina]
MGNSMVVEWTLHKPPVGKGFFPGSHNTGPPLSKLTDLQSMDDVDSVKETTLKDDSGQYPERLFCQLTSGELYAIY